MRRMPGFMIVVALLLSATGAEAGISSISAHNDTLSARATVPVFVDSGRNSIMVKGPFMDTCIGVESPDSSFDVSIGRRIRGSNSAVEILVGAGSAPDQDRGTIHIKFVVGEETFKVKAFKTRVTAIFISGGIAPTCKVGENVPLAVQGEGMDHLVKGLSGAMIDVADNRFHLAEKLSSSTESIAKFALECTAVGQFTVNRTWFKDSRVPDPAGDPMVRGSASLVVTVSPADVPRR